MTDTVAPDTRDIGAISRADRLTMYDREAEAHLLAALLGDHERIMALVGTVYAGDLSEPGHRAIFATILALESVGDEVTVEALEEIVEDRCRSYEAAWPGTTAQALAAIEDLQHIADPDDITLSVRRIATCTELRRFAVAAAEIVDVAEACAGGTGAEAAAALQRARALLLAEDRTTGHSTPWSDLVDSYGVTVHQRHAARRNTT